MQDYRALADWGFDLGDVGIPVELWKGDADQLVSMEQSEDLVSACPGATLRRCAGEGHLVMISHAEEILRKAAAG